MLTFLIILISAIEFSYATPTCNELHKSQLASLTERMNQLISSLYTPTASKAEATTTSPTSASTPNAPASDHASLPYNTYYPYPPYTVPVPQVVYVSPTQYPPPGSFIPPTAVDPNVKPFRQLYYPHKEMAQPFDFAFPGPMDVSSPWTNYYDNYPFTQYPPPPPQYSIPTPYQPLPYPPPYPYPEYPKIPSYPPPVPSYQAPPQVYPPPPTSYPFPPLYHKPNEIPSPSYYL